MLKKCLIAVFLLFVVGVAQAQESTKTYSGQLDNTTDHQDYPLTLKSGDAVLITTTIPDTDNLDTVLTLYSPAGDVVASNDDVANYTQASEIAYVAPADGTYRVSVSRYDTTTSGHYQLDVKIGGTGILDYAVTMTGTELTRDTTHFRIHYTRSGADTVTNTFLDDIAQAFETAWRIEIDKMGWPKPPSDGLMGGNALYDVYVTDVIGTGDEALAYTSPQALVGDNPNTPQTEKYASTSYIEIDNDFHNLDLLPGQTTVSVMRSTAIHEFHHAIQMGYDGEEPHRWLSEATAVWMESVAAGKDQDATGYVSQAFQYPELCLGTPAQDRSIMYGEWTFLQLLTDDFGKDAVQKLWRDIADYDGLDAIQKFLAPYNTDVPHEAVRYRLKNLARDYQLAPLFDATVWLENTITGTGQWTHDKNDDGVQELGASYYDFKPPAGVYDLELRSDAHKLDLWAIGVTSSNLEAIDLGRGGGVDTSKYQETYLMVFNPTYDNDVETCISTDYQINVVKGKGTTNPVTSTWNRTYFEPLKAES